MASAVYRLALRQRGGALDFTTVTSLNLGERARSFGGQMRTDNILCEAEVSGWAEGVRAAIREELPKDVGVAASTEPPSTPPLFWENCTRNLNIFMMGVGGPRPWLFVS